MLLQSIPNPNYMNGTTPPEGTYRNFHNLPYSGDPDFPVSGKPEGLVKGTPEYNAESSRQIIEFQAMVAAAEKAYHMKLIVIGGLALAVAYHIYKKSNNR